jgi:hypothetical protein
LKIDDRSKEEIKDMKACIGLIHHFYPDEHVCKKEEEDNKKEAEELDEEPKVLKL